MRRTPSLSRIESAATDLQVAARGLAEAKAQYLRAETEYFDAEKKLQALQLQGRGSALTPVERDVLREVLRGSADKEISSALGKSARVVKFHVQSLLRKHQVSNRRELILVYRDEARSEVTPCQS